MSDIPSESELSERVAALFTAIGQVDVDTARALATAGGWTAGDKPLRQIVEQVGANTLLVQATPMHLTLGARSTVRAIGFRRDAEPLPLWFLFEARDDTWWCTGVVTLEPEMKRYLLGDDLGHRPERPPAPAVPPVEADLDAVLTALCAGLGSGNPDPVKAMTRPDRWGGTDRSNPARYFKKLQRGSYEAKVVRGPMVMADVAVAQLAISGDQGGSDEVWVVLERWAPGKGEIGRWAGDPKPVPPRWVWTAATGSEAGAALALRKLLDRPSFDALPAAPTGTAFVAASLTASDPPQGDVGAWREAIRVEAGQKARAGAAKGLPALGRAIAAVEIVDASGTVAETRWVVLERIEGSWTVRAVTYLAALEPLVEGAGVGMPDREDATEPPAGADRSTRAAVEQAAADLLARRGIRPGADGKPDFSGAKPEDVAGLLPELMTTALGALLESGGTPPSDADEAPVTVDLTAGRPEANGSPTTSVERELTDNVRDALGRVFARAAAKEADVKVDADFLKDHGGELMGALFGAIAQSFLPKGTTSFAVDVPGAEPQEGGAEASEAGAEPREGDPEAPGKKVDVNLDLGALFAGLLERAVRQGAAQPDATPSPTEDED